MTVEQTVPLFSAKHANQDLDFQGAINRVLGRFHYALGEEVYNFEKEFAHYLRVGHCVSVANGTDAIELALKALDIQKNDRVATVANAGFYSSTAIYAVGAVPVYVDVDPRSLTMCTQSLAKVLDEKPKAIIVTHLYGQLADIENIAAMAQSAGIPLIEDCAQAHGARKNNRMAGSFGTLSCFSFYPTKNLGALGDGGAVVTSHPDLADSIRSLRQYGWDRKYHVARGGGRNSRLDEIQAAVLRDKLVLLDQWNLQRKMTASRYNQAFSELPVQCPVSLDEDYVAHLYVMRVQNRSRFREFLAARGITTEVHYPVADYAQKATPLMVEPLAVTEQIIQEIVTIPCFPNMPDSSAGYIITAIHDYYQSGAC